MNRGKSKVVAGVLGILLGAFGIHHFYLGSTMAGVILLLVTVLSCGFLSVIPWIIGVVEGILLLVMKDEEFDARYNLREPGSMEFVFTKPQ
jgi:TM2 domain-containing membrane protein YozV